MAEKDREPRSRIRPNGPRTSHGRVPEGAGKQPPAADPNAEREHFDEADEAVAHFDEADEPVAADDDARETRFVSWQDLQRVADEAADIDAVVRSELEAVGERRAVDNDAFVESVRPPPGRRRPRAGTFVAVFVAAAVAVALLIARNSGEQPRVRATSAAPPTGSAVTPRPPPSDSPPAAPPKAIVALLSFSAPCWVDAVADGRRVFVGTIPDGSRTIRAKRALLLTLGNAGGEDVLVNGRRVSTGAVGEVVHLSFVLRKGKVTQLTN